MVGEEAELVEEAERYQLAVVRLNSTDSLGSGTSLLDRGLLPILELIQVRGRGQMCALSSPILWMFQGSPG